MARTNIRCTSSSRAKRAGCSPTTSSGTLLSSWSTSRAMSLTVTHRKPCRRESLRMLRSCCKETMLPEVDPIEVDRAFFSQLIAADTAELAELLTDDFLLIAVANAQVVPKSAFLAILASGQLKFLSIEPADV